MLRNLKLVTVLTFGPVVAFILLSMAGSKMESEWQEGLRKAFKDVPAERLEAATLLMACSNEAIRKDISDTCSTLKPLWLSERAALWTAILGFALPCVVVIAGRLCRANRRLLLVFFKPGLYLTNLSVCVLILLQAAVVVAAIYYAESIYFGRIHLKLILGVAVGAGLCVLYLINASLGVVHKARTTVVGKSLGRDDYPELWNYVNDLSAEVGTVGPRNLVVGLEPNFYVTEADVRCLDGELTGRTMYISLALCRIMTLSELRAVIAHELGHFKGQDTEFSLKFYPIYRGATDSLAAVVNAAGESGAGGLALIPAIYMLSFFLESFAVAENKISRERELAADAVAAANAGGEDFASALVKIVAFANRWTLLNEVMASSLKKGTITFDDKEYEASNFFSNMSNVFVFMVATAAEPDALKDLGAKVIPHPTDSHPPLHVRLEALGSSVEAVADKALGIRPTEPASSIIDNLQDLEIELSLVQQYIVGPREQTTAPEATPVQPEA